jgi:hypothetical protein
LASAVSAPIIDSAAAAATAIRIKGLMAVPSLKHALRGALKGSV